MTHFIQTKRARYKCEVRDWSPVYESPYIRVYERVYFFFWRPVHEDPLEYGEVNTFSAAYDAVLDYENELRQRALQKV